MFNDRIAEVLNDKGGELAHGYTYSGHPVCAAVALENIRILQDEKIVETCKNDTAPYLAERWKALGEHPLVGEARIVGMVGALELVPDKPARRSSRSAARSGSMCRDIALQQRPDPARHQRFDAAVAAAGDQPRADRRVGREGLESRWTRPRRNWA